MSMMFDAFLVGAMSQDGALEIVRLLLENGADPNLASKAGQTPLQLATAEGHEEIAALLRSFGAR